MWSTFHTSDQYQWRRANCHGLPTAANARCAIALFRNLQVRAAKVTSEWHDQPRGHPICWMQIGAELTKVRVFRTHLLCNVEQIAHWRWLLRWGIGWSGWSGHLADGIAGFLHLGHEIHSRFQAILAAGTANWSSLGSSFGQGGSTDSIIFHWSRRCCGHTLLTVSPQSAIKPEKSLGVDHWAMTLSATPTTGLSISRASKRAMNCCSWRAMFCCSWQVDFGKESHQKPLVLV